MTPATSFVATEPKAELATSNDGMDLMCLVMGRLPCNPTKSPLCETRRHTGKKRGDVGGGSATPVQASADTRDDRRVLVCPVAVISSH